MTSTSDTLPVQSAAGDWTAPEVAAIVADYRLMLSAELRGEKVNKAERNRALQSTIGRSKGSIEFKHQNISGVLYDLGLRFMRGYKPAVNYQQLLADEVLAWLAIAPLEAAALAVPPTLLAPSLLPTFEAAIGRPENERVRRRTVAKIDYEARDAANRALGRLGEQYVIDFERRRLHDAGETELSRRVRWISEEDGDGAGYDIGSHQLDGTPKLIEVKTTMGSAMTPFFVTSNELAVSNERADHYHLFRLHSFPTSPTIRVIRPPLQSLLELIPTVFRARIV